MNLARRSGAPSAFACLLGLTLAGTCATMTACSAASGSGGGGWLAQSGGGPLGNGEGSGGGSGSGSGGGSGAGVDSGSPSSSGGAASDAGMSTGEAAADEGGLSLSIDAAPDAPAADAMLDAPAVPTPPDFTLVDTAITGVIAGTPVTGFDPILENATIDLAKTGTTLSVRLNTLPAAVIGSVGFALDATYTHTENTAPYFLCSDDGTGNITSCAAQLVVGKHTLTATPYSGAALTGTAGTPVTLDFTIVDAIDAGGQ